MSTGAYHPCASDSVLACAVTLKGPPDHFVIQIMGDCLAVLHDTPAGGLRDILFIWDWKTGQLLTVHLLFLSCSRHMCSNTV
ncbi:hypothetical protein JB92DRAFT_2913961 [Gautieria morchelliformis]|nr:hypothetical protein JB92DRAFT_2913961 [Gautieria morchelliformis]